MSQSVVIWDNKTHSRDRHPSPQHAHAVIEALIKEAWAAKARCSLLPLWLSLTVLSM